MALIISDCGAMRIHDHQMALITSDRVPLWCSRADFFDSRFDSGFDSRFDSRFTLPTFKYPSPYSIRMQPIPRRAPEKTRCML